MFIGEKGVLNALNKNISEPNDRFNKSRLMLSEKSPAHIVKYETGCEKLADGHIRYEIDDSAFTLPPIANIYAENNLSFILIQYLNDDDLYGKVSFEDYLKTKPKEIQKIYADLTKKEKDRCNDLIKRRINPENVYGGDPSFETEIGSIFPYLENYYPTLMEYTIKFSPLGTGSLGYADDVHKIIGVDTHLSPLSLRATLIHEVQHQIQSIEEWESGSNMWIATNTLRTCDLLSGMLKYGDDLKNELLTVQKNAVASIFQRIFLYPINSWSVGIKLTDERFCARLASILFKFDEFAEKIKDAYYYYDDIKNTFEGKDAFKVYQGRHGEVEARNSSFRSMFPYDYLKTKLFNDTVDIPLSRIYTTKNVWDIFGIKKSDFIKYKNTYKILCDQDFRKPEEVQQTLKTLGLDCCLLGVTYGGYVLNY